jgi:hypothetical protein
MRGFISVRSPVCLKKVNENWIGADWVIVNETTSKGDTWIHQRAQPLLIYKLLMKTEPHLSPKSSTKAIPKVTRGFVSAHSPCWLRNSQRKLSRCQLRNHHRNTSKVMRGFGRARSPCWLRKIQRKCCQCRLGNSHRNTFERWRMDSKAFAAPVDSEKDQETTYKGEVWIRQGAQPLLT